MSVYLSKKSTYPFELISSSFPFKNETEIYSSYSYDTNDIINDAYIIIEDENYPIIYAKVENETGMGTSLWISKTDIEGNILEWSKTLTFKNINADDENDNRIVLHIKVKWSVLNNPILLKTFKSYANINFYDEII